MMATVDSFDLKSKVEVNMVHTLFKLPKETCDVFEMETTILEEKPGTFFFTGGTSYASSSPSSMVVAAKI